MNDARFGTRMTGEGRAAERIQRLFEIAARRSSLDGPPPRLATAAFRRVEAGQLRLFD
jgi:hypothetical protein